jgi:hypothetical protein
MPAVIGRLKNGAHGQLPLALGDDLTGRADEKTHEKSLGRACASVSSRFPTSLQQHVSLATLIAKTNCLCHSTAQIGLGERLFEKGKTAAVALTA